MEVPNSAVPVQPQAAPAVHRPIPAIVFQFLRFGGIGGLNTAVDVIIFNALTKAADVTSGPTIGFINLAGFVAAVVQGYLWNQAWAFSNKGEERLKSTLVRTLLVGGLGLVGVVAAVVASRAYAPAYVYLFLLAAFVSAECVLWSAFGLSFSKPASRGREAVTFLVVSAIGAVINSGAVTIISGFHLIDNADLNKNLAKLAAVGLSLIWNFIGYKLVVFRN